jgi:hypothetical protein
VECQCKGELRSSVRFPRNALLVCDPSANQWTRSRLQQVQVIETLACLCLAGLATLTASAFEVFAINPGRLSRKPSLNAYWHTLMDDRI